MLHADAIDDIDFTAGKTLLEITNQLAQRGIVFAVAEADPGLRAQLDRFGITAVIGADRYYDSLRAARHAFHEEAGDSPAGA